MYMYIYKASRLQTHIYMYMYMYLYTHKSISPLLSCNASSSVTCLSISSSSPIDPKESCLHSNNEGSFRRDERSNMPPREVEGEGE